ncbi:antA/AntB antirepressor family protein [Geopseudomonas guangdongensis]|uniref:Anti-repressor protein n=1 Tax=Geopseudomonas guangdongensis TaxID=1245526 RepID=A0A1H2I6L7_9GAMM|nr:antA/AntB antirepressor family protein [Pseudomonas guangdongensis]SDU39694.1 anti-repressor protein [Pseudomonas guangdongensis]
MKIKRTGKSFNYTPADCPKHVMLTLGFTEEQTERMIRVRRILPFVESRTEPCIDARKLWEKIGRPEARFDKWVSRGAARIMDEFGHYSEVVKKSTPSSRKPRTDYILSRNCAAHLAMSTQTPEGREVRHYFLDMEELALKLIRYTPLRGSMITTIDNQVAKQAFVVAGNKAKAGELPKNLVKSEAFNTQKTLMSLVCRVMTGLSAGEWRAKVGKGIRDVLCPEDLNQYARAYDLASMLQTAGKSLGEIEETLKANFGNSIQVDDYLTEQHPEVA